MNSNILVNFWDYFTSPSVPEKKIEPEIKSTELKEIHEVIPQNPETPKNLYFLKRKLKTYKKELIHSMKILYNLKNY